MESQAKDWLPVVNPATNELISQVPETTHAEKLAAVYSAKKAFKEWKDVPVLKRVNMLFELREAIVKNSDKLTESIIAEIGKTQADAKGDVQRGLEVVEYATGVASHMMGETVENVSTNIDIYSVRQPLGVVSGICPFNFPAMIPLWMFPLAVACGNTMVLKPSEKDPGAAMVLMDLVKDIFPPGVVNVIHGSHDCVDFICDDKDIKAISFVGGNTAGEYIHARGTATGKRVQSNMGAKNHATILPDASKERTLDAIVGAAFGASGQRCMALPAAVFVGQAQEWIPELVEKAKNLKVGPGSDGSSEIGPLITCQSKERVEMLIQSAVDEGADVILDGRNPTLPDGYNGGNFVGPTIIDNVEVGHKCYQEEIFGPVLNILRVDTLDEAIELINSNQYGNGTALFTQSGSAARKYQRNIEAGQLGINVPIPVPLPFFSFTGNKKSFVGATNFYGKEGVKFYTNIKTVTTQWWEDDISSGVQTSFPTMNK
eukprot:TRINITY_DN12074_c0_g1_i1.p1 TRINITY_DN12074_c0_g1~~TRINITY_DN12074_c0_g1_i1.p1  ORF type:complete len:538 (-),score=162.23 TRINITY_DN12074_c0_g1_i1:37-1497(-)